jgi:hypothetical protein
MAIVRNYKVIVYKNDRPKIILDLEGIGSYTLRPNSPDRFMIYLEALRENKISFDPVSERMISGRILSTREDNYYENED